MPTHTVTNQVPPLVDWNLFTSDPLLTSALKREGGEHVAESAAALGERLGSAEVAEWADLANRFPPRLVTHDPSGNRIDQVEYHAAWHQLMTLAVENGQHSLPWEKQPLEGAHVGRAALFYLGSQVESGHGCPISMTASVLPALRLQPDLAAIWEPAFTSRYYDRRFLPTPDKRGALAGMAMTEKQGGSDVRSNTTVAMPIDGGGPGGEYMLTGHKWFCSAPMCDAFLVLANAPRGLSCFLLPRFRPDGTVNEFRIQRLKDKLGNRSNASSEVELEGAWARMVEEEGRGVATIIEMVNGTRLDCTIGSAALIRRAVVQAIHHCSHRSAFGKLLTDQPAMKNVLADLVVESEAATLLMMRVAATCDRQALDQREAALRRILIPVAKFWVTKRASGVVNEALECLGGNGYVEESVMPRLLRESPVNAIWEGSGNVIALDVMRAVNREPHALEAFMDEIGLAGDRRVTAAGRRAQLAFADLRNPEEEARRLVELLAVAVQASLLVRFGRPEVAEAFAASRLECDWGKTYGTLPPGLPFDDIRRGAFLPSD